MRKGRKKTARRNTPGNSGAEYIIFTDGLFVGRIRVRSLYHNLITLFRCCIPLLDSRRFRSGFFRSISPGTERDALGTKFFLKFKTVYPQQFSRLSEINLFIHIRADHHQPAQFVLSGQQLLDNVIDKFRAILANLEQLVICPCLYHAFPPDFDVSFSISYHRWGCLSVNLFACPSTEYTPVSKRRMPCTLRGSYGSSKNLSSEAIRKIRGQAKFAGFLRTEEKGEPSILITDPDLFSTVGEIQGPFYFHLLRSIYR